MTFGELKKLNWLKFDRASVDVLLLENRELLLHTLWVWHVPGLYGIRDYDIDALRKLVDDIAKKENISYPERVMHAESYLDITWEKDIDGFDDCTVLEFNMTSFKVPTIILAYNR